MVLKAIMDLSLRRIATRRYGSFFLRLIRRQAGLGMASDRGPRAVQTRGQALADSAELEPQRRSCARRRSARSPRRHRLGSRTSVRARWAVAERTPRPSG